jgi:hypothetical protein
MRGSDIAVGVGETLYPPFGIAVWGESIRVILRYLRWCKGVSGDVDGTIPLKCRPDTAYRSLAIDNAIRLIVVAYRVRVSWCTRLGSLVSILARRGVMQVRSILRFRASRTARFRRPLPCGRAASRLSYVRRTLRSRATGHFPRRLFWCSVAYSMLVLVQICYHASLRSRSTG